MAKSVRRTVLERDEFHCQWHLVVESKIREATDVHHLFRPKRLYNKPEYLVSLCAECHRGDRHTGGRLTDEMLIDRVMIPYIWGGDDLTPKGFQRETH